MTTVTIADIVGDNAKHRFAASPIRARRLFLTSLTGASRFGDINVAAACGVALPASIEVTISASDGDITDSIDLSAVYAYVPSGDTLTITYGV